MPDLAETAVCVACGTTARRDEMFGAPPDLRCEGCTEALRERYDTRLVAPRKRLKPPVVTALAGAVAAAAYVATWFLPGTGAWVEFLWIYDEAVRAGEVWRLVTAAFLHAAPLFGFFHIGFNVLFLFDLGRGIEGRWGHLAMLGLLLGGIVGSSVPQWAFQGGGIGLSGLVYALAGFLFALRRVDPVAAALMNPRTVNALVTWFVVCLVLSGSGTLAIANWAHGAGAVWGFLAGLATRVAWRKVAVPALALATAALLFAAPYLPLAR